MAKGVLLVRGAFGQTEAQHGNDGAGGIGEVIHGVGGDGHGGGQQAYGQLAAEEQQVAENAHKARENAHRGPDLRILRVVPIPDEGTKK